MKITCPCCNTGVFKIPPNTQQFLINVEKSLKKQEQNQGKLNQDDQEAFDKFKEFISWSRHKYYDGMLWVCHGPPPTTPNLL